MSYGNHRVKETEGYQTDLAFIHDAAFGDWARQGGEAVLARLHHVGIDSGLVVDLGCGSGITAELFANAGFGVLGIDQSEAMVHLARERVQSGEFVCSPLLDAELPQCRAVIAIGEVFNYLFDERMGADALADLFERVFRALVPGGLFMFDLARSGRVPQGKSRDFKQVDDWVILYEAVEEGYTLTRRITTFRRQGESFHKAEETHKLRLYSPSTVSSALIAAGFHVEVSDRFGDSPLAPGHAVFTAVKPT
jgi:SAM-dependent methyltransferase